MTTIPAATAGATMTLGAHFTNKATGLPADPTTVTITITKPDTTSTAYVYGTDLEVTREAAGVFVVSVPTAVGEDGIWTVTIDGTGPNGGSITDTVLVAAP